MIRLLSNAVKFTPEGGQVRILVFRKNGGISIAVSDTGIGMAPENIPQALEPFGQIDGELSRKYQGTGLGLSLVKNLTELHGGILTIESEVGAGTTVTIELPSERIVDRAVRVAPIRAAGSLFYAINARYPETSERRQLIGLASWLLWGCGGARGGFEASHTKTRHWRDAPQ